MHVPAFNWHLLPGGVSNVFWHAATPSNTLLATWRNAAYGRDESCPTNFQAELFPDGRFEYRYEDRTVEYEPVFPFDWDGDGLENSVDPDPLVAGPDAHGTNVEWYNVVCSNVFAAAEGGGAAHGDMRPPNLILSPRTADVNTNAYYFVEVVAERGPAPIYFIADGASRLGNPIVVARAGETNHVPLLIGANYSISSSVPVSVSVPEGAELFATAADGSPTPSRSFTLTGMLFSLSMPTSLGYEQAGELSLPSLDAWMLFGGEVSWSGGCCMRIDGTAMSFECRSCLCGGCSARIGYAYEGYSISVSGPSCGCGHMPGGGTQPTNEAFVVLGFDRRHVLMSTQCLGYGQCSSSVVLALSANGGPNGGHLEWGVDNPDRLSATGDGLQTSGTVDLAPEADYGGVATNAALSAITQKLFSDMGFVYDTRNGKSNFIDEGCFMLSSYIEAEDDVVNCFDQAHGVMILGNLLGVASQVEVVRPFGYMNAAYLVGIGTCNNPFFDGSRVALARGRVGDSIEDVLVTIPASPLAGVNSTDRSFFPQHAFTVSENVVFDACVGPALGLHSVSNYIDISVDHSTEDERLNGFYSSEWPGTIETRTSTMKIK